MPEAPHVPSASDVACAHCGDPHPASYTHCPKTGKPLQAGKALIGRIIAQRYKVVGLLGEGGMGAVYVAEHTLIGRKVALKRLHPELASDAKAVARFMREARAAAATGHENIVEILDLGDAEDGAPFLVMEYLKGKSLATTLRREGRLAPSRACHIVGQVLAALNAVHKQHIVHRDLKPDNIFLTRRSGRADYVKVLDFGISKMKRDDDDAMDLTRTGVMLGTPFYMSPEQARGKKDLDHRVDLYAAGVILYECLSGRLPFDGQNYHALLQAILAGTPPPVTTLVPDLDPGLGAIVSRAIARSADERYQSAREMLTALLAFGASDIVPDENEHSEPLVAPSVAMLETTPLRGEQLREHVRRSRGSERPSASSQPERTEPLTEARGSTSSLDAPAEDDEVGHLLSLLPRPRRSEGSARRFVATSSDWIGSGTPKEPLSFSTPAGVREAITPYRAEGASRPSPGGREPSGAFFTGTDARRRPPAATPTRSTPTPFASDSERSLSMPPGDAHVKGTLLLAGMEHLEHAHGHDTLTRVIHGLAPDARARLTGVVLPVAWFPLEIYEALLVSAERVLGQKDGSVAFEIGAATAARDLPSTHRLFMQSATPAMALARIPQLWRTYHSRGDVVISQVPAGGWRLEVRDVAPDPHLHAMAMAGFYGKLLELAGARDVRVALLSSRGRGDERTITSLRWR